MDKEIIENFLTKLALLTEETGIEISGGNLIEFEYSDGSYSVDDYAENLRFDS